MKELLVENSEGARTRILALTNCLEAGPEVARGGGEVGHHKEHACCLPSGFIGQLGFLDVTKVCGYALLGLGSRHAARLGTRALLV